MIDLLVGVDVTTVPELSGSYDYFVSNNIQYAILEGRCDIHFDSFGQLISTEGAVKLSQNIVNNLLTMPNNMDTASDLGSNINAFIGEKINNKLIADISDSIISCLEAINSYNEDNASANEYVYSIDYIDVSPGDIDPRQMNIIVSLTTIEGNSFNVNLLLG